MVAKLYFVVGQLSCARLQLDDMPFGYRVGAWQFKERVRKVRREDEEHKTYALLTVMKKNKAPSGNLCLY